MDTSPFAQLPDELLEAIILHLPPAATLAFAATCRRSSQIAQEPLVWRRHCIREYRYWQPSHEIKEKLQLPPTQTRWRDLFGERQRIDREAREVFESLLLTQQERSARMEKVAEWGYDVKDLLVRIAEETPDEAEDVLARRYHANAIMGCIHRTTALEKWMRMQRRRMVRLEEVLGAYDLFVLAGRRGDLNDIDAEFDRIAEAIRRRDPDFDDLSIRRKAGQIAKFLRSEKLVGNPSAQEYHDLRNNFISIALFEEPHTSLPLQSVAIYCAIARRLGVNAKPSNYPHHVHAVIHAPAHVTLDGKPRGPEHPPRASDDDRDPDDSEVMYMDPWHSSTELPRSDLVTRLVYMGIPTTHHPHCLSSTSNLEIALRTGRNIMNSVQEARERIRHPGPGRPRTPDVEAAWYSMLWSMFVLGESSAASALHRRRQILPYLIEHYQQHFPEDLGLVERVVPPLLEGEREHHVLMHLITTARKADANRRAPCPRPERKDGADEAQGVAIRIGTYFRHRRYGYRGMVVGWDTRCGAEPAWIEQMRVDDLPRGREQPFYNVVADDKSNRYVAEENIVELHERPGEELMGIAGRWFKRWDEGAGRFVSNMRDEYPDD